MKRTTLTTLSAHGLTALLTLVLAAIWFGGCDQATPPGLADGAPVQHTPGPSAPAPKAPVQSWSAPAPVATPAAPAAAVPEDPRLAAADLTGTDAEERTNIRVYAQTNRSVVNITSEVGGFGLFDDESSGGTGSGFVISHDGLVLTNFHVVEGAEAIQVMLHDGSGHEATIVGLDPSTDVALLRIDAPADLLTPLALGDSSHLLVGQRVLAVGNPFGLERTLTTGIVSALDRMMRAQNGRQIKGIIQTDAAINPGNSGGPLLNTRGEVIGMTTAIVSQVGQSAGIGFAVPINAIKRNLDELIAHGRVIRADLGVRRVLLTDEGLLVVSVEEGSAADRAGIRQVQIRIYRAGPYRIPRADPSTADILVAIDGKPVRSADELLEAVEAHRPGEVAQVTVLRDGVEQTVSVTLDESP